MDYSTFDDFLAVPRVNSLALSTDGGRLVAAIAEYDKDANKLVSALWELDPDGGGEARRLTHSAEGESQPVFEPDGSLLFVSSRSNDDIPALWRLPASGEATKIASTPGGISAIRVAAASGTIVVTTTALPGATDAASDKERRKARKDAGVSAILHTASPTRFWDSELGPDETRLQVVAGKDLTPAPGRALDDAEFVVTPDGKTVIAKWQVDRVGWPRPVLVGIDTETGEQRKLADAEGAGFAEPAVSRDGRSAVCSRWQDQTHQKPPSVSLLVVDLESGETRDLITDPDSWPESASFSADDRAVFFSALDHGHRSIFRVELETGEVTRVTTEGSFSAVQVSPDNATLFAIRAAQDAPAHPVRIDLATGAVARLLPPPDSTLPGTLERVETAAADGTTIEGWLILPRSASPDEPAPLLLWVHGGPLSSWSGWSWRWNPWQMTAKGYAVLMPDPALSIGYGAQMVERAWERWGEVVYEDLMAITDAVEARPDIDAERTAAMGASFGGYMINWIAGQTDRFNCLITMAGTWALENFWATSDMPGYFRTEWGPLEEFPDRYADRSPRRFLDRITTPTLVIHGSLDQRVPINQTLHLWTDLQLAGIESAYLSFPDEGHWILKPGNARVWHETVWAWLAKHLDKQDWTKPPLL